jgi:hypothetical protein
LVTVSEWNEHVLGAAVRSLSRMRFDTPEAEGELVVPVLGVTSLLLDDGETALMTDGFLSRPSLTKVVLGSIAPTCRASTGRPTDSASGRRGVHWRRNCRSASRASSPSPSCRR